MSVEETSGETAFGACPRRLAEVDVKREQFPKIAEHVMHDEWLHLNPRQIDGVEQVLEILEAAA